MCVRACVCVCVYVCVCVVGRGRMMRAVQYVRALGAAHVIDYKDADAITKIRAAAGGHLRLIYDTVGASTAGSCVRCAAY